MNSMASWRPWLWLLAAISLEVLGTSTMKFSQNWTFALGMYVGLMCMWACIALSYFSLAKASVHIPIGVAFALWDALGLVFIVAVSFFMLQEPLTLKTSLGLLCVLLGGFLVHLGTDKSDDAAQEGTTQKNTEEKSC